MKFEVSGTQYEFDAAPEKLMGDELLVIDENLAEGWAERWAALNLGIRDVMVITYLAAKRAGEPRSYGEFLKTFAPLTFKPLDDETVVQVVTGPPVDSIGTTVRNRKARRSS